MVEGIGYSLVERDHHTREGAHMESESKQYSLFKKSYRQKTFIEAKLCA